MTTYTTIDATTDTLWLYWGLYNEIPTDEKDKVPTLDAKVRMLFENNSINSKEQIETFYSFLQLCIDSPDLLSEVPIMNFSYSVENEIVVSKSTDIGVKFFYIDEDGDFGYNNTPYNGRPERYDYDKGDYGNLQFLLHELAI